MFITGAFTGSSQLGYFAFVSNGGNDIFIAKLSIGPLGLSTNDDTKRVAVYPNPTSGHFHLDCYALKQALQTVNLPSRTSTGKLYASRKTWPTIPRSILRNSIRGFT